MQRAKTLSISQNYNPNESQKIYNPQAKNMTLIISIITIALLVVYIVYRQWLEKKKYQDPAYLWNLQQIGLFFDTIQKLNKYVTWVHRDQIRSQYLAEGLLLNKTYYYKKEKREIGKETANEEKSNG